MRDTPEDIVCFEQGSGQPPWIGSTASLAPDREAIRRLVADCVVEFDEKCGISRITGVDRVGLVQLPSGRRLVIRSKIENIVILEWLAYLGVFPPLESWLADTGVSTGTDFHHCISRLFLYELEKLSRLHLRKDYTPHFSMASTIRGRVVSTALYRSLHRLPHIPQQHRTRTLDTPYNMVLALTLDKLPMLMRASTPDDRTLLARSRDQWAHISREIADPVCSVTEAQWACPQGYRTCLQLARLILIGATLDSGGGYGGQAFTLSLSSVWERGLRQMVQEVCGQTGWNLSPDSDRTRKWDDSVGQNDPNRWLTVDVMVTQGEMRWVLDAKYKRAFGSESRTDRFQMCAYAVAFDSDRVTLVYPLAKNGFERRVLLDGFFGPKRVTIDSINLPMSSGPDKCKAALINMCNCGR